MDELLEQFLIEGPELVQQASDDLLALDATPHDTARIDGAFRAIHTLKGSVGLFDLPPMGLVLHAAEDLLGEVRAGRREIDRGVLDVLVSAVLQTERWLAELVRDGHLADSAPELAQALAARLRIGIDGDRSDRTAAPAADAAWADALYAMRPPQTSEALVAVRYVPAADSYFRGDDPIAVARAAPDVLYCRVSVADPPAEPAEYDPFACSLVIELLSFASLAAVTAAFRLVADQVSIVPLAAPLRAVAEATAPRTLRVDAERIDRIADLVDELVVAKNGLGTLSAQLAQGLDFRVAALALGDQKATFDRLVGGLHRAVMGARRVPVTPLLRRFPRLVRELAADLGKEAELEVDGGGVEMDKAAVDGLFEPLTHLLRNAVDHGVEPAGQRALAGKPVRATLTLTARLMGDRAVIELRDDGRGLDPSHIRRVARERNVVPEEVLAAMDDRQVLDLVFRPGFSTASAVTELSGRGVGLDAVRTAVGRLGGLVTLESAPGAGAVVRLTVPLTMTLTQVLVVSCRGERYAVPLETVVETVRIAADQIAPIRAGHALVLRDRTLPLVQLGDLLGQPPASPRGEQPVLVVQIGQERVGVGVDEILERMEIVQRPLSGLLSQLPGVKGAALLGDGQVMLVLDLPEMAR